MSLLFDQNLSRRLPALLAAEFPGSEQVFAAGLATADDRAVWAYAAARRLAVVSKDSDFVQSVRCAWSTTEGCMAANREWADSGRCRIAPDAGGRYSGVPGRSRRGRPGVAVGVTVTVTAIINHRRRSRYPSTSCVDSSSVSRWRTSRSSSMTSWPRRSKNRRGLRAAPPAFARRDPAPRPRPMPATAPPGSRPAYT